MLTNALKTAIAVLRRKLFFTGVSLFAISFTLMVLMTCMTLLDHLLNPLGPSAGSGNTASIGYAAMWGENNEWNGNPGFKLLHETTTDLPGVAQTTLFTVERNALSWKDGAKVELVMRHTDEVYWQIYAFDFLKGRAFDHSDLDQVSNVIVINRATADMLFPGEAVGQTLELDNIAFRVVGVVENVPRYDLDAYADAWAPLTSLKDPGYIDRWMGAFNAVVQLDGSLPHAEVREEFIRRCRELDLSDREGYDQILASMDASVLESIARKLFSSEEVGDTKIYMGRLLGVMLLGILLFMTLPALNLVNLNLSRVLERSSEIGVRRAFGATSGSLILQLLVENLVLVFLGALLAVGGQALLLGIIESSGLLPHSNFNWNIRIFAAAIALILCFSLLSGIIPAWRMSRMHPVDALKGVC